MMATIGEFLRSLAKDLDKNYLPIRGTAQMSIQAFQRKVVTSMPERISSRNKERSRSNPIKTLKYLVAWN